MGESLGASHYLLQRIGFHISLPPIHVSLDDNAEPRLNIHGNIFSTELVSRFDFVSVLMPQFPSEQQSSPHTYPPYLLLGLQFESCARLCDLFKEPIGRWIDDASHTGGPFQKRRS